MKHVIRALALSVAFVVCAQTAMAAKPPAKDAKVKFYNFDELLIDGEVKKPKGVLINPRGRVKFGRLLKLKKSFMPELFKTAKDPTFR